MLRLRIEVRCALLNAALSMTIQRGMKSGQINNQNSIINHFFYTHLHSLRIRIPVIP